MKQLCASLVLLLLAGFASAQEPETTVGMSRRISDLVIPGTKLEVLPIEDRKIPVVMRILQARADGNSYRYELEFFALEPGTHDLKKYLKRSDGTSMDSVPPIIVKVTPVLPPGQIQPNKLQIERSPWLGGYRLLMIVGGVVWVIGMVVIALSFFLPGTRKQVERVSDKPLSLADKLRPLVEGAVAGKLTKPELSQLERNLLAFWRKRLKLENADPEDAILALRNHAEAGPLLQQLEDWLHNPNPKSNVNVESLLKPYTQMAPETLPAV
jgi:hypothetical protein